MSAQPLSRQYDIVSQDYDRAGEASASIKQALRQLGIEANILRRVSVAAYEAEMNLVIHSLGGTLSLLVHRDAIILTAQDLGPGIPDIETAMRAGFSTADDKARGMGFGAGMGLPNARRMSDDFYIHSVMGAGTTVKSIVNLRKKEEPHASA